MTNKNTDDQLDTDLEDDIKTIGQLIKKKREEKNLSLKVISQQTKIHIGLLEQLELDQLDKLPSKTYVRGFVKSTSKILGLNQEEALTLLDFTYATKVKQIEKKIYHAPPPENSLSNNFAEVSKISFENIKSVGISYFTTTLKYGSVIVLIALLGINLKNYVKNNGDELQAKLPTVLTTTHQKSKPVPKIDVQKNSEKQELAKVENLKINLIQENKKEANSSNELVVKDVKLKTVSNIEKQFDIDSTITKEDLDIYLPKRFRVNASKGVENVFVNATEGDSWITYKVDDKEIKKYILRQGRTVFMKGANIRLFIGNTKNVKVFYNNQLINLGLKIAIKNLVFPEELKSKYMNPLFVFQKDGSALTSDEYVKQNKQDPKPAGN